MSAWQGRLLRAHLATRYVRVGDLERMKTPATASRPRSDPQTACDEAAGIDKASCYAVPLHETCVHLELLFSRATCHL